MTDGNNYVRGIDVCLCIYNSYIFIHFYSRLIHRHIAPHDSCKNTYDTLNYRSVDILSSILVKAFISRHFITISFRTHTHTHTRL